MKLPIRGRTVEEIEREIKSGKAHSQADLPKVQGQEGVVGMGQSPSTQELLSMIVAAVGDGQGPALPAMPQVSVLCHVTRACCASQMCSLCVTGMFVVP